METQTEVFMVPAHSPSRPRTRRNVGASPDDLARDITGLSALDAKNLRQKWLALCGAAPPPGLGRLLMIRALAYRLQEQALGGLKPSTRRFLRQFSDDTDAGPPPRPCRTMEPGTVLVREWHGTSHQVTIL